jgi:hypothetical protein
MEAALSDVVKFASQVDVEVLGKVRAIAKAECRHLQALIDEALRDLVEKKSTQRPQADAMAVYRSSLSRYRTLYERLAK